MLLQVQLEPIDLLTIGLGAMVAGVAGAGAARGQKGPASLAGYIVGLDHDPSMLISGGLVFV